MKTQLSTRVAMILAILLIANSLLSQTFQELTGITLTGVKYSSASWGDYDRDGYLDLIISGNNGSSASTKIYRNNGNNTFTSQDLIALAQVCYSSVAWGDYDNDGNIDILLTGTTTWDATGAVSKIYRNNGDNTFTEQTGIQLPGVYNSSVAWGDYDNDGYLDFIIAGQSQASGAISRIYHNNRNGTFTEQSQISLDGVQYSSVAWGDYDNDGYLDLVLTGYNNSFVGISKIFRNTGNNNFIFQEAILLDGIYMGTSCWGDYDNDGDLDLLLAGRHGDWITKLYRNNGDNSFSEQTGMNLPYAFFGTAAWGDCNNDGNLDLIITDPINTTVLTNNYPVNSFTEQTGNNLIGFTDGSLAAGDFDNDNDLDVFLTGDDFMFNFSTAGIFRNLSTTVNTPPSAPSGLSSEVNDTSIILRWNPVTGDASPAKSLSYNLRIGTSPGANNIVSSMALSSGKRTLSGMGNMQLDTYFMMKKPPKGTFYWSVQAVDNSFIGGPFAAEQSFVYNYYVQASGLFAGEIKETSLTLNWQRGNGTACRVFAKKGNAGRASPVNNQSYTANSQFASGSQIGTSGWYCVYNGTGTQVSITGLEVYTDYIFQVFEYDAGPTYYTQSGANNPLVVKTALFGELTGTGLSGSDMGSVACGDYDNDGYLDVLITGRPDGSVNGGNSKVFRNLGNNTFQEMTAIVLQGLHRSAGIWGDYDNDGDLDIIISGYYFDTNYRYVTKIYRNNGNNIFTEQTGISLTGVCDGSLALGDYDNDGDLDLLLTGTPNGNVNGALTKVYRNNGDNTFSEQFGIQLTGLIYSSIAWGDYDNDSDLDILLTGLTVSSVPISKIYQNTNGTFTEQTGITLTGVSRGSASWGDYDADGYLDILLAGNSGNSHITEVYHNNGNSTFSKQFDFNINGTFGGSAAWLDYNNDGLLDFFVTCSNKTLLYRNNNNGTFTEESSILTGAIFSSAAWGDYNNDGDIDIVLTGSAGTTHFTKLYRNYLVKKNIAPSAPSGLTVTHYLNTSTFSWNPVTSDETPPTGITYNVRIGRTPGGNEVLTSMSAGTGFRKIVQMGNCQLGTFLMVKDLSMDDYYWSVQAVDNGYSGGSFATESQFTIDTVQASDLSALILDNTSLRITWKNGNGVRRAVFCKQGSSGSAYPQHGSTYMADPVFEYGDEIGSTGWYCVYNGRDNTVDVSGLLPHLYYLFHVIEYLGTTGNERYFREVSDGNLGVFSSGIMFQDQTGISLPAIQRGQGLWGDYDNDGDLDILLSGYSGSSAITRIYRNNGNNSFTEQTGTGLPNLLDSRAAWGDYDNDGDLDILLSGSPDGSFNNAITKVWRNNGNNTFTSQDGILLTGLLYGSVTWEDYDNDGYLDILISGVVTTDVFVTKLYRNNGNNTFTQQTGIILSGVAYGQSRWKDYNNDGLNDILVTGMTGAYPDYKRITRIFRNMGENSFAEQTGIIMTGVESGSVAWGDYDKDGNQDILSTGYSDNGLITKIYHNNGDNSFSELTGAGLVAVSNGYQAWGDYDGDGDPDILLTGKKGSYSTDAISKIYRNNGNNTFTEQTQITLIGISDGSAQWGDYDNDGDLDILMTGIGSNGYAMTKVYRNGLIMKSGDYAGNTKPDAPSNLMSEILPSTIRFSWSSVRNDETPVKTMSYNIYVTENGNSEYIYSPVSDTLHQSGYRKYIELGNRQFDTVFTISKPHSGIYHWSVQAVDQGYGGGYWAPEQTLMIQALRALFSADTVCQGLTTHFTNLSEAADDPIISDKWLFGDGDSSMVQAPVHVYSNSGTFDVKLIVYSISTSDTLVKQVIVKRKPVAGFIAPTVCFGSPTIFTDQTVFTEITPDKWLWNFGDGTQNSNVQSPSHTYTQSGTFSVQLSTTAGNGCSDSFTRQTIVSNYPSAEISTSGPTTFCSGGSVTLSVPANIIYTYAWYLNGNGITGATTSSYTATQTGSYSVAVTNPAGNCRTNSSSVSVTAQSIPVAPTITPAGPIQFCQGSSVTLSVTNTSGYNYQWKLNGGAIGTNSNSYVASAAGTYSLTVTNATGCYVNAVNSVSVTVNAVPTVPTVSITGNTTFCQGNNVILSVTQNPDYTYQWQNNGSNISGATTNSYTTTATGIYSLTLRNSSGCTSKTENVSVTSVAAPSAPQIIAAGPTTFCNGSSVDLSVTGITGYSYQWKLNGGAVGTNTYTYSAHNPGTYTITVTNSNNCTANSSNSVNVTVNSLPNVSTINLSGPTLLCDGESVTLSVPSTSGYIYKWRDDYGYIPGATSTSYTADVTGSYQLEISNTSSCSVMTQQVDVTVNPVPSAPVIDPGSYTLDECPGEAPTKISVAQPVAGYIYQWLRNGEPISGETKTYLEGYLDQADYAVDAILNSCSARSQTLEIFYQNAPEKPTVYAVGPTVWYLACSNNTAATYRWYYNGVLIPGADKYYYIANQKMGEYAVSIANEQGCYTMSDAITIPITGIEETDVFSGLKIYPNPTPGIFTVEMNNQVFGEMNIDIFNTEGKIILRLKVEKSTEHFMTHVDLSGQVKGIYLVNMKLDKYNKVSKLIID